MADLPPDYKELLEEFDTARVEAVVVGGFAVAFHGRPRATKDIDLLLEGSSENLAAAAQALARFGAPANVVQAVASMKPTEVVFLGQPPSESTCSVRSTASRAKTYSHARCERSSTGCRSASSPSMI